MSNLPIDPLLPEICAQLKTHGRLVLAAPPGAGKTTRVPLALAGLLNGFDALPGKVVVLEPRRIAARMAAERMASLIGERVGKTVGLSTRVDKRVSKSTRIEVITDGLFTRRLLADPELSGVSAVLFDEVHERGLNTDLGLALAQEVQTALREDLMVLAMSATLDAETFAEVLGAETLVSEGRQFPIETRYLGRTRDRIEDQMAAAIRKAVTATKGSILAFLPGAGEIRRTAERLQGLQNEIILAPLYGALSPENQDLAIQPTPEGQRKIVLATDIAESALTIDGVHTVIDSGLARVPEFDPGSASSKLVTIRAARANVDQRRGRAGRLGPGICYRLWDEAETRGLVAAPTPEILNADLSGLLLTLAEWGERDPFALNWLTKPPAGRIAAARAQLETLGALDPSGALTSRGKAMSRLPLPPRMAALVTSAETPGEKAVAARIAVLAGEAGIGGQSADLSERLSRFEADTGRRAKTLLQQAKSWSDGAKPSGDAATLLAKAWPDRIAKRRSSSSGTYLLASGRAAQLDETSPLSKSDWLIVVDMIGAAKSGRITLAAALKEQHAFTYGRVESVETADFDAEKKTFKARNIKRMGAIILSEAPLPKPSGDLARAAFVDHMRTEGFAPSGLEEEVRRFLARLNTLRKSHGDLWPHLSLEELQETVADWLLPTLGGGAFKFPSFGDLREALKTNLDWPLPRDLDQLAPLKMTLPSSRAANIVWLDERAPLIEARLQEVLGAKTHLSIADGRVPVTLQLLSPGGKPVATTQDLPSFWTGGYLDMAKDMRGRYPKHDWPDDPSNAKPHAGLTKARLSRS